MTKLVISLLFALVATFSTPAHALTQHEQVELLKEINAARAEIQATYRLVPKFLQKSVGTGLDNADRRLEYAERILGQAKVGQKWFCSIDSSFDGAFSGRGDTKVEAISYAKQACAAGSRSNGFFCKESSISCAQE